MKSALCVLVIVGLSSAPVSSAVNICAKPPAASLMLKVLKPTAKVLLDCVADVLILHRVNASFLTKVVTVVCEYHVDCYRGLMDVKDMHERRSDAGECLLKEFANLYPMFVSANGSDGIDVIRKMMACLHDSKQLEFEDDDVTNAVMHWLYEVLRTDA